MTTKIYNLGRATKMVVTYDASHNTALVKCDHPLVMDGLVYRQEVLADKSIQANVPANMIPDITINYNGEGGLLIKFKDNNEGLVKFSSWLLTDNALKQIKTAILELKMEENELSTPEKVEELIDELYGI
jgi:hypothetical protein